MVLSGDCFFFLPMIGGLCSKRLAGHILGLNQK
jgi:hypothetical protein